MNFEKQNIIDITKEDLVNWLKTENVEPYRADQILRWIYFHQADSFSDMMNIGKALRCALADAFCILRMKKEEIKTSKDGSKKYIFKLEDGCLIESVLIPEKSHYTLCISTQAGCAMDCGFCFTGKRGFKRNLTKAEIVSQVRDILFEAADPKRISNIVLMGMGEPLANYENVKSALQTIMESDSGLGFLWRRVTLSTAGIVPKIAELGRDMPINLAVSLNAADNKTRSMLMPINLKYPIEELIEACRVYPLKPRGRITFEYILIKDVNDSLRDAEKLSALLKNVRSKINLIPFNEHNACGFNCPEEAVILKFQEILLNRNYTVIIRRSRGKDIRAACGQLG